MKASSIKHQVSSIRKSKLLFLAIFVILGFVLLQIPVNVLAGARVKFTLFDLFAPISGAFLGSIFGAAAVILMQSTNLAINGFSGVQQDSILKLLATLRFLPLIFGVLYFSLGASPKNRLMLIIPIVSIIIFNLHPIGRTVWFYSLFWLIPILIWPFREKFLLARSLGSTFCAHAVGGAVWIWAFNLPANVWISLIPIVVLERSIFALGISASYILFTNLLGVLTRNKLLPKGLTIDRRYLFPTLRAKM